MRQAIAVAVFLEKQKLWGQAIGVEVTRSKDTLVAFMGVLLSGNYYVPVSREKLNALTEKLKEKGKSKTAWLNEKIDEELRE